MHCQRAGFRLARLVTRVCPVNCLHSRPTGAIELALQRLDLRLQLFNPSAIRYKVEPGSALMAMNREQVLNGVEHGSACDPDSVHRCNPAHDNAAVIDSATCATCPVPLVPETSSRRQRK